MSKRLLAFSLSVTLVWRIGVIAAPANGVEPPLPLYASHAGYWSYVAGPMYYAQVQFPPLATIVEPHNAWGPLEGERPPFTSAQAKEFYVMLADYTQQNVDRTPPPEGWAAVRSDVEQAVSAMKVWSRSADIVVERCRFHLAALGGRDDRDSYFDCPDHRSQAAVGAFDAMNSWLDRACAQVQGLDAGVCQLRFQEIPTADECWPRDFGDWAMRHNNTELDMWPVNPTSYETCT